MILADLWQHIWSLFSETCSAIHLVFLQSADPGATTMLCKATWVHALHRSKAAVSLAIKKHAVACRPVTVSCAPLGREVR